MNAVVEISKVFLMWALVLVCAAGLYFIATLAPNQDAQQISKPSPAYITAYEQVLLVAGFSSEGCVRMATLTIMGRWDIAQQYDEVYGKCSRGLVERLQGGI